MPLEYGPVSNVKKEKLVMKIRKIITLYFEASG